MRSKFLIGGLCLLATGVASAATRYAAPAGAGTACTQSVPCSLNEAVNGSSAACGDTVSALNGTYNLATSVEVTRNCPTTNRFTIQAANPQQAVLNINTPNGAFFVRTAAGSITIKDFKVVSGASSVASIRSYLGASNLQFIGLELDTVTFGLSIAGGSNQLISGVTAYHHNPDSYPGNNDGTACFSIGWDGVATSAVTIQNSVCKDIWLFGNQKNVTNLTIQDNLLQNVHDHGVSLYDCTQVVLQRNRYVVTRTNMPGTWAGSFYDSYCSTDVNVRNNSIYLHNVQVAGMNLMPNQAQQCSDGAGANNSGNARHRWSNNIISTAWQHGLAGGGSCIPGQSCVNDSYNIYHAPGDDVALWSGVPYVTLAAWQLVDPDLDGVLQGRFSLATDPMFTNANAGDLTLRQGSPAIDAGDNANCALTIVNGRCDMGAFEYAASSAIAPSTVTNLFRTDAR